MRPFCRELRNTATPTPSGPQPDLDATQRMAGPAVTDQAAQRAEREALDDKPTSAITPGG
jgi:hypothetical protein